MALEDKDRNWLLSLIAAVATLVGGGAVWHDNQMNDQATRINGEWQRQLTTADDVYARELTAARTMALTVLNDQREDCMQDRKNQREANMQAVLRLMEILEKREK